MKFRHEKLAGEVTLKKLELRRRSACYVCTLKLRFSSRLYLKVAIFLREHAPRTTSVLKNCGFPAGAAAASAYYVCTEKLRFSSRSCGSTLRVLRLYLKAAIFEPELPRTRGESNPRPRDCESRRAKHETTSKGRFASKKFARDHSDSASTRAIPTEGSPRSRQIRATARAMRHTRSPQRVRRGQDRFARRHSESDATRTIPVEGSSGSRQIRTGPQRERFDTHDLRRGFAAVKTDSHGTTARAIRHARSPQRVRRGQDKFARRHSESASTRTISAEGTFRKLRSGLPPPEKEEELGVEM